MNKDVLGGYRITIQNTIRKGEYKYNIYSTDIGELFRTNDLKEFVSKLEEILSEIKDNENL